MKRKKAFDTALFLLALCWTVTGFARPSMAKEEFVRVIKKEYPIAPDGSTTIENRYGKVQVHTWNKERVRIEVRIVVQARSESAAEDVFDRIHIRFSHTPSSVRALTEIGSSNSWWSWFSYGSHDFQIHYEVYVPPTHTVSVSNRYGDVWVAALQGNLDLSIKYGNFIAEGSTGRTTFYLGYGSGTLTHTAFTSGRLAYAKLRVGHVQKLRLQSKYSKIWIDQADRLDIEGRYDNYVIDQVDELVFEGQYADLEIEQVRLLEMVARYTDLRLARLTGNALFDMEYGDVAVERVARGFGEVDIRSRYTDFRLAVEAGADYRLEVQGRYADLHLPAELELRVDHERPTSRQVEGYRGSGEARSIIRAQLEYGGLRLR